MKDNDFKSELRDLASYSLWKARKRFADVEDDLIIQTAVENRQNLALSLRKLAEIDSPIPGYSKIDEEYPRADEFIVLIADMRDSTKHLLHAITAGLRFHCTVL